MSTTEQAYKDHIKDLEQQIQLLKEQVDFLTRKLYGTKSEKTSSLNIQGQMSLFDTVQDDDIIREIRELDLNNLTPRESMDILYNLQSRIKNRW